MCLLFALMLFAYDKLRGNKLNFPIEEDDYDFTEDSSDPY